MKRRIIAAVVGTAAAVALAVNGLGNVNGLNLHRDVNGLAQHTSVTVKQSRVNGLSVNGLSLHRSDVNGLSQHVQTSVNT
jgi:hypothetical protein